MQTYFLIIVALIYIGAVVYVMTNDLDGVEKGTNPFRSLWKSANWLGKIFLVIAYGLLLPLFIFGAPVYIVCRILRKIKAYAFPELEKERQSCPCYNTIVCDEGQLAKYKQVGIHYGLVGCEPGANVRVMFDTLGDYEAACKIK